jgi:hypothetical protein
MRVREFVIEAEPGSTSSADDIRAAIATGVSQAQRDRYDQIPSTILPSWMSGLKGALTGDWSGKKDDAMTISKVVQDLKKDQPQDYGFPAWNNQRLIDTAKKLLTGQIAPPDLAPNQQDEYKEKVGKNYQQQQQQQPSKPVQQQPVQQQQPPVPKPVQPKPKPVQPKSDPDGRPPELQPLKELPVGYVMKTKQFGDLKYDGKAFLGNKGFNITDPAKVKQFADLEMKGINAERNAEWEKMQADKMAIQAKAFRDVLGNRS